MSRIITAIYADGVLRPLIPLELPEQTEVEIEVKAISKTNGESLSTISAMGERTRIHRILVESGVVPDTGLWQVEPVMPISPEEEEELGRAFAIGKPLSEIIIEDREERF